MATTQHTLDELYELLGRAMADVMEHDDCPNNIYSELSELACTLVNLPRGSKASAVHIRTYMPACLSLYTREVNLDDDEPDNEDEPEAA
jgi:hypothetical protein